jgi:L-malate glycosyltransferase
MTQVEQVPASQIAVIPNFVDVPSEAREWPSESSRSVTIGMVSRLTPIKRHDVALRAVKALLEEGHDLRLHIVGDGESREAIARLIAELDLSAHVTLLGELRGGAALHQTFDISLATSDSEGSPNSVLEAMAAGRPVVATDVGGTRNLIRHGTDGFLVPAGSPQSVATALRDLITDPALRHRFGNAGRSRAKQDYSPEAVSARLLALYQSIAA